MDRREIGTMVISIGFGILLMGLILLLDTALMIAGNFLIIIGLVILINTKLINLFHMKNIQGTFVFGLGIFSMINKFAFLGFILEAIGLTMLFYDKIPTFKGILKRLFRRVLLN